ncbi:TPA: transglycosylase SLT domain-containing protein [Xanthomonas vasicola pv. zeae]|uniref:LysM peptidoglycan-binding domain-containing protein n=5 Tax=Xanthomonas vasicola TaxID=56459 RepID=A0ABD7S999_XANVA|nr:transglycosylase SLT domain-containing protein [Xanthomonas vasicola]AVQ06188.1 lytic transglycosylase [Xanthomonas vasicola pv. vasculorum]AZM70387.1 lytic transglycosylase [Xanthomonas vasicola pv. vasculorum]AZR21971.1 LysM peptidoglycan-binding domain-containing protein [Xanthomonas vasicola]KFA30110.1 lytic transglycosylase [Xanthomonas vasicola pv. vasculorum NCPPB 1326]KFA32360.1 lytic transglycosylase [Xanthomonas vasicola pv. vasculorum NCPPB 1381]
MRRLVLAVLAACSAIAPAAASPNDASSTTASSAAAQTSAPGIRNGREIFSSFLEGRADPGCDSAHSDTRWEQHFSRAPARLVDDAQDVLPLFGYVVDELRKADMPTEFALIPFVESGYRPGARNGNGPAGLWQFVTTTARNHQVPVGAQYDGRLSAVDSTTAAVRYLKTLYGMFGGDWRLALMAYNAGEYRVLQAMRSAGMNAQNARPSELPGMSKVTYDYVEKLHALACVLDHAQQQGNLLTSLDRPVPVLTEHALPAGTSLNTWAGQRAIEPQLLARLNPALAGARAAPHGVHVLAPIAPAQPGSSSAVAASVDVGRDVGNDSAPTVVASAAGKASTLPTRTHTVRNGESAWAIARRYGVTVTTLLTSNGLDKSAILKPGMVLSFDDSP